jgi:hypothetical protein
MRPAATNEVSAKPMCGSLIDYSMGCAVTHTVASTKSEAGLLISVNGIATHLELALPFCRLKFSPRIENCRPCSANSRNTTIWNLLALFWGRHHPACDGESSSLMARIAMFS